MSALLGLRQPEHVFGDDFERVEGTALALARAVDTKARYMPSHCTAVMKLSTTIGAVLGVGGVELQRLRLAALLHDVGKLSTPDCILLKPSELTRSEWDVIEEHPRRGHDTVLALGLRDEARWVLHHHERIDGSGYPTGLAGTAIPFASRIIAVADAYDVMTSKRTYKTAWSPRRAIIELDAHTETQFDASAVDALRRIAAGQLHGR